MAGINAGWTLLLETPWYLPPRPTASRKQSSGLTLMLTSEVLKPYSLPQLMCLLMTTKSWSSGDCCITPHLCRQLLDDSQRHCPLFFSL